MGLKLFRSTGYSSLLMAGEARLAMHPGWMILAVSLWAGFVSNVSVWRWLAGHVPEQSAAHVLALAACIAGGCGMVLSLFGWRKTLKPVATVLLFLAALAATSIWGQALPVDASLFDRRPISVIVPSWASLLRWQVSIGLALLALVPSVWVWQKRVRRLPGPQQLTVTMTGLFLGFVVVAATSWLLSRGL
jgi:glucan phosphoethanolaminetransferase (alkaline phosphatase superfamily)